MCNALCYSARGAHVLRMSGCPAQVSDYKVKVMIAEPKGKRGRRDPLFSEAFAHAIQQPGLEYGTSHLGPYSAMSEPSPPADREMQRSEEAINDVKGSASGAVTLRFMQLR